MNRGPLSLWFTRLRWFAFAGQMLVLGAAVLGFDLTLPWMQISAVLLLIPGTNLLVSHPFFQRFPERSLVGALLALDTILLTTVLNAAGGPTNPFTIVYLLHVVLAAVMLRAKWAWIVAGLSSVGFASLFLFMRPVPEWSHHGAHQGFSLHLHGMLIAYVITATLVAYFLSRIMGELQQKERRLQRLEGIAANQKRLASLTTITAGAAHELGTPLATIAVVSHELEKSLQSRCPDPQLLEDVALLKDQTARCKVVLQELSAKTGDLIGEAPQTIMVIDLLNDVLTSLDRDLSDIEISGPSETVLSRVPRKALGSALQAVVKNAFEASQGKESIRITIALAQGAVNLDIKDQGCGIDEETLERIGEPFFSTKSHGNGMGLGVYLARLTLEQLGGNLQISSVKGYGSTARLSFPADGLKFNEAA